MKLIESDFEIDAKFYYMRNIIHDWPDNECKVILSHLRDAMGPDSLVLIDDMVLPNKGTNFQAMQLDLNMMAGLSAMERNEKQWAKLIDSAGFKIVQTYLYTESLKDCVLACVPK